MATFTVDFEQYILIPEGAYKALIKDMEITTSKFDNKDQFRVIFELQDFTFEEKPDVTPIISAFYTRTLSPKGNLVKKFLKPFLGETPTPKKDEKSFAMDDLIGQECCVQVEHKLREDDGEVIAIVSKVSSPTEE